MAELARCDYDARPADEAGRLAELPADAQRGDEHGREEADAAQVRSSRDQERHAAPTSARTSWIVSSSAASASGESRSDGSIVAGSTSIVTVRPGSMPNP